MLPAALKVFAQAGSSVVLPARKDQGREKGGRLHFGKPLTSEESMAVGNYEQALKQSALDKKDAARKEKEDAHNQRGIAAASAIADKEGDPTQIKAAVLKDFLRWKGVDSKELTKAKKDDLVAIYNTRFSLGSTLRFQPIPTPNLVPPNLRNDALPRDGALPCDDTLPADARALNASLWDSEAEGEDAADVEEDSGTDEGPDGNDGDDGGGAPLQKSGTITLEDEYNVESIRNGPRQDGKYLIHWEDCGSDEDTWEPKENLPPEMVDTYLKWRFEDSEDSD